MKLTYAIIFLFLVASTAQAGVLIEPTVGYASGSLSSTTAAAFGSVSNSMSLTGTNLGLRLGYNTPKVWFAAEIESENGTAKDSSGSYTVSRSVTGADIGANIGMKFRAWLGYGFSHSITFKNTAPDKYKGTDTKLGIGFMPMPKVSVNLEYYMESYSSFDLSAVNFPLSTLYSKFSSSRTILGISFPFNL